MTNPDRNSGDALRFRLRNDLEYVSYALGYEHQFVVKDPLRLQYFMFGGLEKGLLDLLHQPMSVFELKAAADDKLGPERFELADLKRLLRRLLNDNLLIAERCGNGTTLLQLEMRERNTAWWQSLFGVLAIRFRGINPQTILDTFHPVVSWMFHPAWLALTAIAFVIALITVGLNFSQIVTADLLSANLADPRTALAIVFALGIVKIFHELGHAFACRSIGRDCHELGIMLLAFVPCLYCNVSDIWMEPNRWKRILVSAAGIYVEMLIAVICVPLWLLSHDGPMQTFWFAMMMICSINTVLINGNPLLRYDGYYVLSDLLQIPNLYSKSQQALSNQIAAFFTKSPSPAERFGFLELYAIAARIYRLFVIGVILFVIYSFFASHQLGNLGLTAAGIIMAMTFAPAWWRNLRSMSASSLSSTLRVGRAILATGLCLSLILLLLSLPVTTRTFADGETELAGARIIYAPEKGLIRWIESCDTEVEANQLVASIENNELNNELMLQSHRVRQLELSLKNQRLLQRQGVDNAREIELQSQSLESAKKIEQQLSQRKQRLDIRVAVAGKLVALPNRKMKPESELDLSRNSSSLASINDGCSVERSEPLAAVFDSSSVQVRLQVPGNSIDRISVKDEVKLIIRQSTPEYVVGVIESIDIESQDQKSDGQDYPGTEQRETVGVMVKLHEQSAKLMVQSPVKACIYGKKMPVYRYLWQEFISTLDL